MLAALLLYLALPASRVQAHADLVRSDPAAGAELKQFPAQVVMEFSEQVELSSANIGLYNDANQLIAQLKPTASSTDPNTLTVTLPSQPDGIYHVNWAVQSTDDGHLTNGSIAFSVGAETPSASLLPPPGTPDPVSTLPPWIEVLLRGLGFLSLNLLAGAVLFNLIVWQPAYKKETGAPAEWESYYRKLISSVLSLGVAAGFVSMVGLNDWQQSQMSAMPGAQPGGVLTNLSLADHAVWSLLVQLLVYFAFLALSGSVYSAASPRSRKNLWSAVSVGSVVVLLWVYASSSHDAAVGGVFPVLDDYLHLLAMTAWIGGLLPLAFLLVHQRGFPDDRSVSLISRVSKRFSRLALASVIVLGLSGLYSALVQIKTWDALISTRYGQAVLLKVGIFAVLIGFGAINQLKILPAMTRAGVRAITWLARTVRIEYGLALVLLLVIGTLMSLSPAYQALSLQQQMGFHESYQEGQVRMDLRVAPAKVGINEFGADIVDNRPGADKAPAAVLLVISSDANHISTIRVDTKETEPGRFTARGSYLSIVGAWQVDIILKKDGFYDLTHEFVVNLQK